MFNFNVLEQHLSRQHDMIIRTNEKMLELSVILADELKRVNKRLDRLESKSLSAKFSSRTFR